MASQEWSEWIGLRRAYLSLVVRGVIASVIFALGVYGFIAVFQSIGAVVVPLLIVIGFSLVTGFIVGVVISRGLTETAGFVSVLITIPAIMVAVAAIIVGDVAASFLHFGTLELDVMIVGCASIMAAVWIVRTSLLE